MHNNEYNQKVLENLTLYNFLFSGDGYKYLQEQNDEDLLAILDIMEQTVRFNLQNNIFTNNIKQNIYKCLCVYKERFKGLEQIKDINELILLLNDSNDSRSKFFLRKQFIFNYINIISISCVFNALINIKSYEQQINQSLSSHLLFTSNLMNPAINVDDFVKKFLIDSNAVVSINYLWHCYPKIFMQDDVKEKIIALLRANQDFVEKYINDNMKYHKHLHNGQSACFLDKNSKKFVKKLRKV